MSKLKEMFSDWRYIKLCLYTVFTAALLYILYFIIKNLNVILSVAGSFLGNILSALSPLFIGLLLAYLINPLVDVVDSKLMSRIFYKLPRDPYKQAKRLKTRRTFSILFSFLTVILLIFLIIYTFAFMIVGQMSFNSVSNMLDSIITYFLQYEDIFRDLAAKLPNSELEEKLQKLINDITIWIAKHISADSVIRQLTNIGGGILNIVLGTVVSIYLIKDKDFFIRLWRKALHIFLPMKATSVINGVLNDVNTVFSNFLRGQLLDGLIVAILSSVSLTLIGLDFAVLVGCFAGLTNIIPYFGPILGMIPAALIGLMTEGISHAILAVVVLLIIQQIDCNIISPKVVGSSTGLHPLFVLIAVTFGGYFWGILGMLLSVPVAAYIKLFIVRRIKEKTDDE